MSIENLSKYEKETLRELTLLHFEIYFHSNYISLFFIKRFCKRVMNSDIVFIICLARWHRVHYLPGQVTLCSLCSVGWHKFPIATLSSAIYITYYLKYLEFSQIQFCLWLKLKCKLFVASSVTVFMLAFIKTYYIYRFLVGENWFNMFLKQFSENLILV